MEAVTEFNVRCLEWYHNADRNPVLFSEEEAKRTATEMQARRHWCIYEVVPAGTALNERPPGTWRPQPLMDYDEAVKILKDLVQESPRHEAALKRLLT